MGTWYLSLQRQGVEFLIWMKTPSASGVPLKLLFLKKKKKKKKAKKNSRDHRSVCLSPLGGPTLSSWDVLDLQITALNLSLPGNVAIKYQLKIIERTEFLYASLRFSFEQSLKTLPRLSSNTASQISILDLAHFRPSKCICLLTQKTHGLTTTKKDIPVLVSEEMRKFCAASSQEQVSNSGCCVRSL